MSTETDPEAEHLEELTFEEIAYLLSTEAVGRLAVVSDHYPQVFPVNYRMDGHTVVFRTNDGTKLDAANHANVAFEVDHFDPDTRSGWSVLIQGLAEDITDHRPSESKRRAERLDLEPWAGGDRPRLVRVIPAHITGRRIPAQVMRWYLDVRGYL